LIVVILDCQASDSGIFFRGMFPLKPVAIGLLAVLPGVAGVTFNTRTEWLGRTCDAVMTLSGPMCTGPATPQQGTSGFWIEDEAFVIVNAETFFGVFPDTLASSVFVNANSGSFPAFLGSLTIQLPRRR
jgi:hypothetical protein